MERLAVIAIGGNSLIKDASRQDVDAQLEAVCETVDIIADVITEGWRVVITHGNGPQVGIILRRSEVAHDSGELHFVPLKNCVADTQDAIGCQIQESLANAFSRKGIEKTAVTVVTLVEVDAEDPSLAHPTKPIGADYTGEKAAALTAQHHDWIFLEDRRKGFRRVVPSPQPKRIVELDAIKALSESGFCVIAAGGGGIPAVMDTAGNMVGVDAVIDKDLTSSLLATGLEAELLIISTSVDHVYIHYDSPEQKAIDRISAAEARRLTQTGQFGAGNMQPKITAAAAFVENGGIRSIITRPEKLREAIHNRAGTHIVGSL